ncbi:membrane protein insertion efficiency factor [Wolffia australiana]
MTSIFVASSLAVRNPQISPLSPPRCASSEFLTWRIDCKLSPTNRSYSRGRVDYRRPCLRDDSQGAEGIPDEEEVNDAGVKVALSMLKFYKREISPLLPQSCRYVPTCSEYSMQAYKKYGVIKGTVLTAWRICRCNPLGGSGFDPPRWFDETPADAES